MTKVRALGLDAGSTTVKLAAVDEGGALLWHRLEETEPMLEEQLLSFVSWAREEAGEGSSPPPLVVTGYGRDLLPGDHRRVTEITCHAAGVCRREGHAGTVIDIGGQDTKVMVVGEGGRVLDFAMNDKCAAGTGRFLEVCARRLRLSLGRLSEEALSVDEEASISSTCTVFAESEIVSLIARGVPVPTIARGIFRAMLKRVAGLARGTALTPPVMLSGGVALGAAASVLLAGELGEEVRVAGHPQLMGAYGAAVLGLG